MTKRPGNPSYCGSAEDVDPRGVSIATGVQLLCLPKHPLRWFYVNAELATYTAGLALPSGPGHLILNLQAMHLLGFLSLLPL